MTNEIEYMYYFRERNSKAHIFWMPLQCGSASQVTWNLIWKSPQKVLNIWWNSFSISNNLNNSSILCICWLAFPTMNCVKASQASFIRKISTTCMSCKSKTTISIIWPESCNSVQKYLNFTWKLKVPKKFTASQHCPLSRHTWRYLIMFQISKQWNTI